ncbi:ABC multidrug transporter Mdr4 [Cordyceps javanica]|uniref:ABC multidrug transporter Mdr4 n=1 Tax=Cordyceps javanica TaxID=43265 RepID=A0A545VPH7_9HYPO|nr:ABC multidrug transporter Mdr4 [Cordyceps javanica]TQW03650.1 ABC multidrug transporter Mdr4 [Cordyceps javanica]
MSAKTGSAEEPVVAKKRSQSAFSYLRLLVAVNPKFLDYVLLGLGVLASIASGAPFPIMSMIFGQLVDQLNSASCANSAQQPVNSQESAIADKVLLTVYIAIANFILIYVATGCWTIFGERLVRRLRYAYLQSLLRQEVAFFETCPAGEVAARLDGDLTTIQGGVSEKVGIVITSISYFVTAYIVAFTLDAPLTGMLASVVPAFLLMAFFGGRFTKKYTGQVNKTLEPAIALASESIANMKLIKAFRASDRIQRIFETQLAVTKKPAVGKLLTAAIQVGLLYFIAFSANALAISQGGRQVADTIERGSGVTLGAVYTVMMSLIDASYIISQVAPFATIFASASNAAEKIIHTIHREPEIDSSSSAEGLVPGKIQGEVEFRNVEFTYPSRPDAKVHDNFNLTIPAGKMTGIVGGSGCGKSTIAALIQRFYDVKQGEVLIDGHDVRDLQLRWLRSHIGYVEQEVVLFDRSIMENIAHGLIGSSDPEHESLNRLIVEGDVAALADEAVKGGDLDALTAHSPQLRELLSMIRVAATRAGLDNFLAELPHGIATNVGVGGGQLSGGQKQRVALARALILMPSILILDEATAALDSSTEAQIMDSIHSLPGERTIICVAHRLSTVRRADNIVVLGPGGVILDSGDYTTLINSGGAFAAMVQSQAMVNTDESKTSPEAIEPAQSEKMQPETLTVSDVEKDKSIAKDIGVQPASDDKDKVAEPVAKMGTFSVFFQIMKIDRTRHRVAALVGLCASIVVGGAHAGEAVIFGNAVENLSYCRAPSKVRNGAALFGLLFFVLAIAEFIANATSAACFGYVSDRLVNNIRRFTLRALLHRDLEWHESEGRTHGSLIGYFTADATAMSGLTGTILGVSVSVLVTLLGGIILGNVVAWKISLVLTACVPLIFASGFLRLRLQARFAARHAKAFRNSVSTATESVTQIKTVSALSLQEEVLHTFQRSLRGPYKATLQSIAFGNLWLAGAFSIGSLVKALAFWWGGRLIAQGDISQTAFFISMVSLLSAAQTSGQLFSLSPDVTKAVVAARRVFGLICPDGKVDHLKAQQRPLADCEKSLAPHAGPSGPGVGVAVKLDSVSFSYPKSQHNLIVRDLSLDIPAGSFVALVGTSGAGKSTILSLIGGLYKSTKGKVTLDGYDIGRRQQASSGEDGTYQYEDDGQNPLPIWDDMALVPQNPTLFSGTLTFNINIGSRSGQDATAAEIERAARMANIHDTVDGLPNKYETLCGPSGSQVFSGGQKQRLCIARALIRNPRLLLLDEPSSAMDTESERLFEQTLEEVMQPDDQGRRRVTVVTIAHRLRTIMKADKIFVIEHGQILDAGTHSELLGRCEKYRQDVMHQTLN